MTPFRFAKVLIEDADLCQWLAIRDLFIGANNVERNVQKAVVLAQTQGCAHPEARWLGGIFKTAPVDVAEARRVLQGEPDNALALCLDWCLRDDRRQRDPPVKAADMGNALAQAFASECSATKEEAFRFANASASAGERDGLFRMGFLIRFGLCPISDLGLAQHYLQRAAELGHVKSMTLLAHLYDDASTTRWIWFAEAAVRGEILSFLGMFRVQVEKFVPGQGNGALFLIGKVLAAKTDMIGKTVFGSMDEFQFREHLIRRAIAFYVFQLTACRKAVDAWTLVGMRLGVVKDIRLWIGRLIWEARDEAIYVEQLNNIEGE